MTPVFYALHINNKHTNVTQYCLTVEGSFVGLDLNFALTFR